MEQRVSLITLGVTDLGRSRRFYERGLGWRAEPSAGAAIVCFQLAGMAMALYGRAALDDDLGMPPGPSTDGTVAGDPSGSGNFGGIVLAHNVRERAEVDRVLEEAVAAGGRLLAPAADTFWGGYAGCFADPDGHPWEVAWNPHSPLDPDGGFRWRG